MADRPVTELDFRMPEFRDAKVEDYEWRDDGKLARKDRWEMGLRRIAGRLGMARGSWEIEEIVERVTRLADGLDTRRLDWLENQGNTVRAVETNGGEDVHFEVVSYHMQPPTERVIGHGPTPRKAIDMAMEAAP